MCVQQCCLLGLVFSGLTREHIAVFRTWRSPLLLFEVAPTGGERPCSWDYLNASLPLFLDGSFKSQAARWACRATPVSIHSSAADWDSLAPYGHLQILQRRRRGAQRGKKLSQRGLSVADIVTGLFSEFLQQGDHHEALNVNVLIRANLFISATNYLLWGVSTFLSMCILSARLCATHHTSDSFSKYRPLSQNSI